MKPNLIKEAIYTVFGNQKIFWSSAKYALLAAALLYSLVAYYYAGAIKYGTPISHLIILDFMGHGGFVPPLIVVAMIFIVSGIIRTWIGHTLYGPKQQNIVNLFSMKMPEWRFFLLFILWMAVPIVMISSSVWVYANLIPDGAFDEFFKNDFIKSFVDVFMLFMWFIAFFFLSLRASLMLPAQVLGKNLLGKKGVTDGLLFELLITYMLFYMGLDFVGWLLSVLLGKIGWPSDSLVFDQVGFIFQGCLNTLLYYIFFALNGVALTKAYQSGIENNVTPNGKGALPKTEMNNTFGEELK